jgi:hypothetical protein
MIVWSEDGDTSKVNQQQQQQQQNRIHSIAPYREMDLMGCTLKLRISYIAEDR